MSAKGLFGVSELNTCCAALTNTNPYTRNRKYYDVVQNLGKGDWGWGGKGSLHLTMTVIYSFIAIREWKQHCCVGAGHVGLHPLLPWGS